MSRFRDYLTRYRDGLAVVLPASVLVLVAALWWGQGALGDLVSGAVFQDLKLEYPVYVDLDGHDNLYVIDRNSRRIVSLTPKGEERWQLHGGERSGGFYESYRLAALPEGGVVAYNYVRNTDDSLQAEEIVRFGDHGEFLGTLVHLEPDPAHPSDDEHLGSLKVKDGFIYYSYWHDGKLDILRRSLSPTAESTHPRDHRSVFSVPLGLDMVANAAHLPQGVVVADRSGGLHLLAPDGSVRTPDFALHPAVASTLSLAKPWDLKVGPGGEVYLLDNYQSAVFRVDSLDAGQATLAFTDKTVLNKGHNAPSIEGIAVGPSGSLGVVDKFNQTVFVLKPSGELSIITGGPQSDTDLQVTWSLIALDGAALALGVWALVGLLRRQFSRKTSLIIKQILLFLPVVILSVSVGSTAVYRVWDQHLQTELRAKLALVADLGSRLIHGDLVAAIRQPSDWGGSAHQQLGQEYARVLNGNGDPWNRDLRAVVYKYQGDKLYFVKNSSSYYGVMFPYGGAQPAHFAAARGGTVESALYSDEYGSYLAGMAPIRASDGTIAGVLEVYHNYAIVTENTAVFLGELLIGILVVVLTVLLVLTAIDVLIFLSLGYLRRASHKLMGGELGITVRVQRRDEIGDLAQDFNTMSGRLRDVFERMEAVRDANARFVPAAFLDFLGKPDLSEVGSGDQVKASMTVFFADIRSFTTLSEGMTPKENFDFVNGYFRVMGPVIRAHGGFIDRYLGDAIQALFPGSPQQAVEAALEMRRVLAVFNQERADQGQPPVDFGVGIHTEDLILGVVGEPNRLSVTVVSPALDLVNRLEAETKHHHVGLVLTQAVHERLDDELQQRVRRLGTLIEQDVEYVLWGL